MERIRHHILLQVKQVIGLNTSLLSREIKFLSKIIIIIRSSRVLGKVIYPPQPAHLVIFFFSLFFQNGIQF